MKKKLFYSLIFLLLLQNSVFAGILEKPRTVNLISTQNFDIFFTMESAVTASLVADYADSFFEEAKEIFPLDYQIRIVVVISPDSDQLDVKYTPVPYNRIIIYDSPVLSQNYSMLECLRWEIFCAVASCVKNRFWQNVSKLLLGDSLQPITKLNMPLSFLNGYATAVAKNYDDSFNLELLSRAKAEGKFPTLFQMYGEMDVYPYSDLCQPALNGFCAYILQKYGIQKFSQFWTANGRVEFFKLHESKFKQIYGASLKDEWQSFYDTIPEPDFDLPNLEPFSVLNESSVFFLNPTSYGFVWFDKLKSEVDLYNPDGTVKIRQLLFLADDVNNISVSPCGRFISISYTQSTNREAFKKSVTLIYDLKQRLFLRTKFALRDAAIFMDGVSYCVVGTSVENKRAELKVFAADELTFIVQNPNTPKPSKFTDKVLYSKSLRTTALPFSPVCAGNGKIAYLVKSFDEDFSENRIYLCFLEPATGKESVFQIADGTSSIKMQNLRLISESASNESASNQYFFEFIPDRCSSFSRLGLILLDKDFVPQKVLLQKKDLKGGVQQPVLFNDKLYYISRGFDHDELAFFEEGQPDFYEGKLLSSNISFSDFSTDESLPIVSYLEDESSIVKSFLGPYELCGYSFFKYFRRGGWNLFKPVQDFDILEGVVKAPGLGVSFETNSDILSENSMILCAGLVFIPLDFTKIFNPTKKSLEELENSRSEFYKNFTFTAFFQNTSTPVDLSLGSILRFNKNGAYDFKMMGGASYLLPFRMNFRKLTMSLNGMFTASTTFWDAQQQDIYPNLKGWPSFSNAYRSLEGLVHLNYTNIHPYGISDFKKLGIQANLNVSAIYDINLFELQKKNGASLAKAQTLNEAIKNQLWGTYAPTQINMGIAAQIEIPHILPLENKNNWILSFPATLYGEVFYTNGCAMDVNAKILLAGKEIQNGFAPSKIFFQRAGLYGGYDAAFNYDTNTVALPDLRDFTRFYTIFTKTALDDSFFLDFVIHAVPVVGEYAGIRADVSLKLAWHVHTKEFRVSFNMKLE